jgi:hypothetical protein
MTDLSMEQLQKMIEIILGKELPEIGPGRLQHLAETIVNQWYYITHKFSIDMSPIIGKDNVKHVEKAKELEKQADECSDKLEAFHLYQDAEDERAKIE